MAAWFAKMFLKIMKPFIKMAIFSAIFESILGYLNPGEEEPAPTEEEE